VPPVLQPDPSAVKGLRAEALRVLAEPDPATKAAAARALASSAKEATSAKLGALDTLVEPPDLPGRPIRPRLVAPKQVPGRGTQSIAGRAALLHAIAHIEFNAINLALDICWRFPGLPDGFYRDWLRVAGEEAEHFGLLAEHLASLGHAYGDFDAHDGLWTMTARMADDLAARLALVPRTLEARGLDATPPLQAKFAQAGDRRAVEILDRILHDEVGHVAVGNRWYHWVCDRDGLDPLEHTPQMALRHAAPRLRPPFNLDARRAAGFTEEEIAMLAGEPGHRS
jgi:uncharacterized ferritin-like protein (DUF455 family)